MTPCLTPPYKNMQVTSTESSGSFVRMLFLKTIMLVPTDGYILTVMGPYPADGIKHRC